jgi:DNA invertase Pin-like site-specific DNA recombinase
VKRYIIYYRISTDKQGRSGLGLEAQRRDIEAYLLTRGNAFAEFTEVESGKHHKNRPQLLAAIELCRRQRATLLIARLDRLARNVVFIASLMESGIEFVAVDMPHASKFTIHILAAVAEHEREIISKRTKDALAAANARGRKLGSPDPLKALRLANLARNLRPPAPEVLGFMTDMRANSHFYTHIARMLNARDIGTPQVFAGMPPQCVMPCCAIRYPHSGRGESALRKRILCRNTSRSRADARSYNPF